MALGVQPSGGAVHETCGCVAGDPAHSNHVGGRPAYAPSPPVPLSPTTSSAAVTAPFGHSAPLASATMHAVSALSPHQTEQSRAQCYGVPSCHAYSAVALSQQSGGPAHWLSGATPSSAAAEPYLAASECAVMTRGDVAGAAVHMPHAARASHTVQSVYGSEAHAWAATSALGGSRPFSTSQRLTTRHTAPHDAMKTSPAQLSMHQGGGTTARSHSLPLTGTATLRMNTASSLTPEASQSEQHVQASVRVPTPSDGVLARPPQHATELHATPLQGLKGGSHSHAPLRGPRANLQALHALGPDMRPQRAWHAQHDERQKLQEAFKQARRQKHAGDAHHNLNMMRTAGGEVGHKFNEAIQSMRSKLLSNAPEAQLKICSLLGSGGFGTVYLGMFPGSMSFTCGSFFTYTGPLPCCLSGCTDTGPQLFSEA